MKTATEKKPWWWWWGFNTDHLGLKIALGIIAGCVVTILTVAR